MTRLPLRSRAVATPFVAAAGLSAQPVQLLMPPMSVPPGVPFTVTVVGMFHSTDGPQLFLLRPTDDLIVPFAFGSDAFVTRISPTGASLVYSTFLGGLSLDWAYALALDAQGAATVVGTTLSFDFPTTAGAFDSGYSGGDAFVTRLSPAGTSIVYSTFLGDTGQDEAAAVALDAQGWATIAGWTFSPTFPTTPGAFDPTYNGDGDAFVARLDMLPVGVAAFGRSTPGCTGPLAASVTSIPRVGNALFALTCGNAPPNATGLLALTANRVASPFVVLGAELWLDPFPVFVPLTVPSNPIGASDVPVPIPGDAALAGVRLFAQFFWAGPTSPPPCPPQGLSGSNALDITIQP